MTPRWGQIFANDTRLRLAASCDNCARLLVAEGQMAMVRGSSYDTEDLAHVGAAADKLAAVLAWLPLAAEAPVIDDVPDSIARAAKEAHTSLSIGNYMSAILMARTVIEATAKANDIRSGDLSKKINAMRDQGLIRPAIADQAHEVRFFGNDMAHGDIEDVPDQIDAEEVLALMGQVLSEVFQGPALMRRLRARRTGDPHDA
jgi:hypothetical protein